MAKCIRCTLVAITALLIQACAHTAARSEPKSVDAVIRSVSVLEGTTIQVAGYLRFGDDKHNLWYSREAWMDVSAGYIPADDPRWNHCITLRDFGDKRSALLNRDEHWVLVVGKVNRVPLEPDEIEIGACSEIGISVLSVESQR